LVGVDHHRAVIHGERVHSPAGVHRPCHELVGVGLVSLGGVVPHERRASSLEGAVDLCPSGPTDGH